MRVSRTYTRHFDLETRQHELLGYDLGEGVPRRALIVGLVMYLLWGGVLLSLFGLPGKLSFTLYFAPPLLVAVFGAQRNRRIERRWNLTMWSIGIRYLLLGHRPVICGGRRASARGEWISRRARWGRRLNLLVNSPFGRPIEWWLDSEGEVTEGVGAPLRLHARPRLYGPDAVAKAYGRKAPKKMTEAA